MDNLEDKNKKEIEIFCYKHPQYALKFGCIEFDCAKCTMCEICEKEEVIHCKEHRNSIIPFAQYAQFLASEIARVSNPNSAFMNRNIKHVLENENTLTRSFES